MKTRNSYNWIFQTAFLIVLSLLVTGCGTTDSGSGKLFKSGSIGTGETFSYTFKNEGTIEYYCDIHSPDMQGQITVSMDAESSDRDTVEMINTQFTPSQLTVAPNTEIVWINRDDFDHTVVEGNPSTGSDNDGGYY